MRKPYETPVLEKKQSLSAVTAIKVSPTDTR